MTKGINKVSGPLPILQPNLGHPLVQGKYCKGCHYQHTGGRRIEPDGSGINGIMLVGDSPWKEEIAANRNFSGAAGRWLDSILVKRGLNRDDFTVTNSYWCAPPALGYNDEPWKYPAAEYAQKQCRPYLDEYVSKHVPKVFVALGNVALRRLTGFDGIEGNHSYVIPSVYDNIPAVPTFHPSSFLQGNWRYTIAFILALAKAVEISNGTYNETKLSIIEDPPPTYLDRPGNSPIPSMMCDIETPRSLQGKDEEESEDDPSYNIIRMGFSVSPWYGCSFPFEGDYIRRAKELVRRTKTLIFWNKNYDLPRLKANGFELHPDVIIIDAMWAWHFLYSDLPKALQFAAPFFYNGKPWKHLHSQRPAFYNCLHGFTNLKLFGGGRAKLQDVVNEKRELWLEGMDDLGRTIPVKIIDWHRAPQGKNNWIRITTDLGKGTIWCTKDHKIWTGSTWKEAQELIIGERIQSSNKGNISLIHGTILGDSHVSKRGRLSYSHCEAQKAWFDRKSACLEATKPNQATGGYGGRTWHTDAGVSRGWRDIFYTNLGKRFVPPPDSAALAVWYCDDGCWAVCDDTKNQIGNPRIALHGFYNQGDAFKWFGSQFGDKNVSFYNQSIAIIGEARHLFFDRIKAYVPPEMQYKLPPFYRGFYCGWIETPTTQWAIVKYIKATKARGSRYCVTVDHHTHRFFTTGGLVRNCMDNAVQMGVYEGTKAQLIRDNRWDRFWSHCVKVDPIYVSMGNAGVKVDTEARIPFMQAMENEALVELKKVQELLPPKLVNIQESFKPLKQPVDKDKDSTSQKLIKSLVTVTKGEVATQTKDGTYVLSIDNKPVMRPIYRRYIPFNPNSRDSLLELMRELKVKIPHARGDDRDSTEAKYLKRFTKYPIFRHCVNYKQRLKFVSTYNWALDDGNRAHTTYGFHPSTWRSSSRNVNLGNIPKRYELAKLFRRTIIAERGCKLIEIDRSGLEAVLVGYWAKSPEYIKLAKAGVHSYLGAIILGQEVPWSVIRDTPLPELKKILKVFKKLGGDDYEGWKRCVHGSSYLLSPFGMHDEYEEYFPTEYAAQKVQDILFSSPAGQAIRQYHKMTLDEVQHKKYLDNSFQYRHYFWGPLYKFNKRDKRWVVDHEGDAKRAIAFRPQSDGAAIQREDILAIAPIPDIGNLLRLPTYDSLVFETPNRLVDKAIEVMANQFNKPIPELGGLDIGFEIKVGLNLAEMDEIVI